MHTGGDEDLHVTRGSQALSGPRGQRQVQRGQVPHRDKPKDGDGVSTATIKALPTHSPVMPPSLFLHLNPSLLSFYFNLIRPDLFVARASLLQNSPGW